MKGVSNLVSGVFLVIITISISLILGSFVRTFSSESTSIVRSQALEMMQCSEESIYIDNATYDANQDCTRGINHTLSLVLRNEGEQKIQVDNIFIETSSGELVEYSVRQSINPGTTRTVKAVSDDGCVNLISQTSQGYSSKIRNIRIVTGTCYMTEGIGARSIVLANANQTEAAKSKHLVGLWRFNNSVEDSSGNGNHGSFGGGSPVYYNGVKESFGKAMRFDGEDDYVEVDDSDTLDITGNLTVEFWIYDPPKGENLPDKETQEAYSEAEKNISGIGECESDSISDSIEKEISSNSNNYLLIPFFEVTSQILLPLSEQSITILNPQSYPVLGGEWIVEFITNGTADLTITPINGTSWTKDIEFMGIRCGEHDIPYTWKDDSVYVPNYFCSDVSYETSRVLTTGGHHLGFEFGNDYGEASNWASGVENWTYRQAINISNTAGNLTDYQVQINLNSTNVGSNFNWLINGTDIRFTNSSDSLIDFFVENWSSIYNASTLWVNVTSLINNTNTTIYMYYGNPSAANLSNGTKTFIFFDDFEDGDYTNGNLWTEYDTWGNGMTPSINSTIKHGGTYSMKMYANNGIGYMLANATSYSDIVNLEWWYYSGDTYAYGRTTSSEGLYNSSGAMVASILFDDTNTWNSLSNIFWAQHPRQVWLKCRLVYNRITGIVDHYVYNSTGSLQASSLGISTWVSAGIGNVRMGDRGYTTTHNVYYDDIILRKYASSEPSLTYGSEESRPQINFTYPTPGNNSFVPTNWTNVNITVSDADSNLKDIVFNWNGTNYTFYDNSLVLALNFNNNSLIGENSTKFVDISKYGNNGTCTGSSCPTFTSSGRYGGAYSFDGSNDYISIPDTASTDFGTHDLTIEVWAKRVNNGSYVDSETIVGKRSSASSEWDGYAIYTKGGNATGYFYSYSPTLEVELKSNRNIADSKWHHIIAAYDRDVNLTLYVDSQFVLTQSISAASGNNMNLYYLEVGRRYTSSSGSSRYFNGTIDEFRIYNKSLNASEIWMHSQSELQKYNTTEWRLYINVTNLTQGNYTYYAWANDTAGNWNQTTVRNIGIETTVFPSGGIIVDKGTEAYSIRIDSGLNLHAYINNSHVSYPISKVWKHAAMTFDGSTLRLYVNGQLVNSTPASGISANSRPLFIGGNSSSGNSVNGKLDEVRIYDIALTPEEIYDNYIKGTK